jgi:hypothetical protein
MNFRTPRCFAALCAVTLAGALPAAAKTVAMPDLSRSAVQSACSRAGGVSYGIHDLGSAYGCKGRNSSIDCSPDGTCFGYVPDLARLPANSADAVLGLTNSGRPTRVGPVDSRITPLVQP